MEKKNFLDHINGKNEIDDKKAAFQEESFVSVNKSMKFPIFVVTVAVIGLISAFMFFNQKVEVADLSGMTLDEATVWTNSVDLMITSTSEYSSLEENMIVEQMTPAGEKVSKNSVIKVSISEGLDPYETVVLPTFDASWSKSSIQVWLEQNGVENYTFTEEVSDIEEAFLIRYRLIGANETTFNRSSEIEFTVSQVVSTGSIEIPDFLNGSITEIDIWATTEGISYEYTYEYNEFYEADKVFYQSVLPGQNMNVADTLVVKISGSSDYESVEMDNFINGSLANAEAWLKTNHVTYGVNYVYSDQYTEYTVMDQSAYEGAVISGEKVILTVSIGEGTAVPDFSELTKIDALYEIDAISNFEMIEIYSEYPQGTFISQSVAAGNMVDSDTLVKVYYSKANYVLVPDFRNEVIYDVESWVSEQNEAGASITYSIKEVENNSLSVGTVIRQDIYEGRIELNGTINIDVSKGYLVPAFITMTKLETELLDKNSSMTIDITESYHAAKDKGEFISQSVYPHIIADDQTEIVVDYSLGSEVYIPDYSDQPVVDLTTYLDELNDLKADIDYNVYEQFDDDVPYGQIIGQSIVNKTVELGSSLEIIVSRGVSYTVPNFKHYTQESIQSTADANGIGVVFEYVVEEGDSEDFYSQYPEEGATMSINEIIKIQLIK